MNLLLSLINRRTFAMSLQLDKLTQDVALALAALGSVEQTKADLAAAQAQVAQLQADATADQAKIDALAAQLDAALAPKG